MSFFRNKYFLLGVLLLVAIAIPLTIYFVQRQQDLRSSAAPTSNLTFEPTSQTVGVGEEFEVKVMVDPGENFVSFVQFDAQFDPQYVKVLSVEPNIDTFPLALEGPNIGQQNAQLAVGIGSPAQGNAAAGAVQDQKTVATIKLEALAETGAQPTSISFSRTDTQILSLSIEDEPGENVLNTTAPAEINILAGGGASPTPSPSVTLTPSPSPSPSLSPSPTAEPTPVAVAPQCNSLTVSPSSSGVAPFSVNITAQGSDDDLITKATFMFGDGDVQDVFDGLNLQTVTTQLSHTYLTEGSFTASVTLTDNTGSVSQPCTQVIEVAGNTGTDTGSGSAATSTPLPTKPPLDNPGGIVETIAIGGGILLTIIGGILLFAL